ncbi:MAG TPA: HepT-like ribonuclease domain-containing protein [Armatimonadota bacterium]|jgi:uncharacterized protein with HEPN domain
MSRHNPLVRLMHMRDFAKQALSLMGSRSRNEFVSDEMLLLAEARLVELIGEAAYQTPREYLDQIPDIPWDKVVGMRHRLIHGYDNLNIDAIYDSVVDDLPVLLREVEAYLSEHQ